MTESLMLALLGGAVSLLIARWGGTLLLRAASTGSSAIPLILALDLKLLAFALGVSVLTGLCFGLAPALWVAGTDLHAHFKTGGRVVGSQTRKLLSVGRIFVVSPIALSLVLATAAGMFARTLFNLLSVDPGYQRDHVVLPSVNVRAGGYTLQQLPSR